ncbi:methyltransferase, partial [Streptomyces sp. 8K308]|uniref:beta-ketoacyl synthase N-terminal-like domain-containing protein n=1 Tax=Streptomyces sp. 8K308 TaxID=2530388 RepID=UPI0010536340
MTSAHSSPRLGAFRTLLRHTDPVVTEHRLRGVRALPAVSCVDLLLRAAAASGHDVDHVELRDITFPARLTLPEDRDHQLVFRAETHGATTHCRVTCRPADDDDAAELTLMECEFALAEDAGPAATLDPEAVRAALAAGTGGTLDDTYAALRRAGVEHHGMLRAEGTVGRLDGRLVAELSLGPAAAARRDGFLLHPALLDAALALTVSSPVAGIRRLRARGGPPEPGPLTLYAVTEPDAAEPVVRLHTADGRLTAELRGVTAAPAAPAPAGPRATGGGLELAVVGMAGRYPGAEDLDAFWRNLTAGHDAITEIPADRWRPGDYPTAGANRFGGFLTDVDKFDPLFFRIPPSTAAAMDPQERLFLETAYGAVEHAGYRPEDFAAPHDRVGVFVGATWLDYRLYGAESTRAGRPVSVTSGLSSFANRVSYYFGFSGPSMAVDTACSSSLTALHLACRAIADGECDAALVGGVNLMLHPDKYLLLGQLGLTSSDGRCRSFGAGGDGYAPGEGVGAILLKPLARALADRDTIHGVVRGTAVNHGGTAAGYIVPNPAAQADVVRRALAAADTAPAEYGYVEAHGTGTALGDPIEVTGLSEALAGRTEPCALGSVKSNIGHLEAAAGIAAVTKTLLQLRHGHLVPSLHSARPNPEIDFAGAGFQVPQRLTSWTRRRDERGELPRVAGVSSFGAGGANAHAVLAEYRQEPLPEEPGEAELLVLSARTPERLRLHAERLARHLRRSDLPRFTDIARTLQTGRPALTCRLALVATGAAEAADLLDRHLAGDPAPSAAEGEAARAEEADGNQVALAERYRAGDLAAVGEAWVAGADVDWAALNGGPARRAPLPGYPFERRRFWLDPPAGQAAPTDPVTTDAAPREAIAMSATEPPLGEPDTTSYLRRTRAAFERGLEPVHEELETAYDALGRYGAAAVWRRFTELGFPEAGGTVADLRRALGVVEAQHRFFDACLHVLERHGLVRYEGADVVRPTGRAPDPEPLRAALLAERPDTRPFVRLVDVCLAAYPEVLSGRRAATEVLFAGSSMDLMAGIYRGNRVYDHFSSLVARFVADAAEVGALAGRRPVRVLEVGAGTGGTSHAALAALAALGIDVEYHYTDIGGSFVAHGRRTFGADYPFARFRVLDMEREPESQGFRPGEFDVVFAVGALHAVSDIDAAVRRVARLLVPSGLLVLGEAVENHDVMAVTIGLLDGWHHYRDPERRLPDSPLLSVDGWRACVARNGFTGFTAYGPGLTGDAHTSHRVLVAAGPPGVEAAEGRGPALAAATDEETDEATEEASACSPADAEAIEAAIAEIVAEGLGVTTAEVAPEASFAEYGVDSILAVKLVERINARLGVDIKPTVVFDHPSVRALARFAHAEGAVLPAAATGPGPETPVETPREPEPTPVA